MTTGDANPAGRSSRTSPWPGGSNSTFLKKRWASSARRSCWPDRITMAIAGGMTPYGLAVASGYGGAQTLKRHSLAPVLAQVPEFDELAPGDKVLH